MSEKRKISNKTPKTRSDTAVQGTNDNSIVSKLSAAKLGYVEDDTLQYVVSKGCRRAPLINRGYYIRHMVMDHVFKLFLQHYTDDNQVLGLGSGFDTAYFRLASQGLLQNTSYFEVDFPEVMCRKRALINARPALFDLLTGVKVTEEPNIVMDTDRYKLLGVDLTKLDLLHTTLTKAGFDLSRPTLILSEVALTYMTADSSSKVIAWMASHIENGVFLTYEQINPDDAFGRVMMNHFDKIGSSLRTIRTYPGVQDQVHRYQSLGWTHVQALDIGRFYHTCVSPEEKMRVGAQEPFDEWEDWHLMCNHYMVLTAYRGHCLQLDLWPQDKQLTNGSQDVSTISAVPGEMWDSSLEGKRSENTTTSLPTARLEDLKYEGSVDAEDTLVSCTKHFGHTCNLVELCRQSGLLNNTAESSHIHSNTSHVASVASQNASGISQNSSAFTPEAHTTSAESITRRNDDKYALLVGGFGEENSHHRRIKSLYLVSLSSGEALRLQCSDPDTDFDRMYHTTTSLADGRLVIFGGRFSPTKPCDSGAIYVLRPSHDETESRLYCKCENLPTGGTTPYPRWRHTATVVNWKDREHILVYGGQTLGHVTLGDLHLLNTETWIWEKVEPSGLCRVSTHSHSAAAWGETVVISGGLTAQEIPLNTVYLLQHSPGGTWEWHKPDLIGILRPRYSHTSAVVGDQLILVGGVSSVYPPPGVSVIDLLTCSVQEYQIQLPMDMIFMPHNQGALLLHDNRGVSLLLIGGGGNCFSFGTHLNQAPLSLNVTQLLSQAEHVSAE